MGDKVLKIVYFMFGDPKRKSLEHRLFNTVAFVNGALNIFGAFSSFYLENFIVIFLLNFISGILLIGMYFLSRMKSIYYSLFWPFNLIILVYLSSMWFFNGGSIGGNHYYFIPALVIATILLRNHNVWIVYLVYAAVSVFLYGIEYFHRGLVKMYPNEAERYLDAGGNYLFVQILTGLLIFILTRNLNIERKKSDSLLLSILPETVAEELKKNDFVIPIRYESVTVLFTDMAGFTKIAETMSPEELLNELDLFFRKFDSIIKNHGMEKIKTIGDAYMAAGGLPLVNNTHSIDAVLCGLEFQKFMRLKKREREIDHQPYWELRLGIHTGSVVAGVVGTEKFAYDIWGDSVNTASRMESSGIPGEVNISSETYEKIKDFFVCEHRGKIKAKNKGEIDMYLVKKIKEGLHDPQDELKPNQTFLGLYARIQKGEFSP
ncbi:MULTISPECIES: adenylate/guanylate cyclase domain-containing protein [Leptospira]|uniref:Adenylate cyclase n=1 Tax=Leptospira weilii str. UI 13098 TaxID=1088542 RepID=M6PYC8_9LEPT|nr:MULTISPECIES: adenylate/guanylate cyclase domain-containing protein [Leptospira]EMJ60786.1 adenylate/guanylate cyclase catalytic domain protein [Leptospira sp. P2653]EMN88034.1 adenylate/guanylate cyclase catalytic domain protein [Leptospira weilii str. UI 13098]MDL5246051.1 adenylate/guanylate cyclase domain-containing protein [Leptospira weilii]OMI18536.1 adenylate cyclase [Leptospira weilii serovar Heyan]